MAGGPIKRSVLLKGHATSVSLEPVFWDALRSDAEAMGLSRQALIEKIDDRRLQKNPPDNLCSALRVWLWRRHASP